MGGFLDAEHGMEFLANARAGAYFNGPEGERMRETARKRRVAELSTERGSDGVVAELRAETAAVPGALQVTLSVGELVDAVRAASDEEINRDSDGAV